MDVQIQFKKQLNLRFIGEPLECQMIQVFRQIENNQSSVLNTISKGKEGEFVLRESMLDKKRREREEE